MTPILRASLNLALGCTAMLLAGCATVTGTSTQSVSVLVVDKHDRPINDMRCRIINGSAEYVGNSPMFGVQVRRSSSDLEIECRKGQHLARATAVSRGKGLVTLLPAMLPGGTAMMAIDHLSGYRYSYPTSMRLRVGEHIVFDASDEEAGRPTRGMQAETLR